MSLSIQIWDHKAFDVMLLISLCQSEATIVSTVITEVVTHSLHTVYIFSFQKKKKSQIPQAILIRLKQMAKLMKADRRKQIYQSTCLCSAIRNAALLCQYWKCSLTLSTQWFKVQAANSRQATVLQVAGNFIADRQPLLRISSNWQYSLAFLKIKVKLKNVYSNQIKLFHPTLFSHSDLCWVLQEIHLTQGVRVLIPKIFKRP